MPTWDKESPRWQITPCRSNNMLWQPSADFKPVTSSSDPMIVLVASSIVQQKYSFRFRAFRGIVTLDRIYVNTLFKTRSNVAQKLKHQNWPYFGQKHQIASSGWWEHSGEWRTTIVSTWGRTAGSDHNPEVVYVNTSCSGMSTRVSWAHPQLC